MSQTVGAVDSSKRLARDLVSHPTVSPRLEQLNLPPHWGSLLMQERLLKGGLIIIAAVTGQGKSTTIAATVTSRLHHYAGFCRSIEDPVELPMHGTHGDGVCVQTPVTESFAHSLRSALRSYPALPDGGSICVVGEVRDSETAAELLRASVNGHLVITTVHASNVNSALQRMAALAEESMGSTMARGLLGDGLIYGIHQTLTFDPSETGWRRGRIGGDILASFNNHSSVASVIKKGGFSQLNQSIEDQRIQHRACKDTAELMKKLGA